MSRATLFLLALISTAPALAQQVAPLTAGVIRILPAMREHGLLLRVSPGYNSEISGNIAEGTPVLVIQRKGGWGNVLYAPGTAAGDLPRVCGVAGALPAGAVYSGPCRTGWAEGRFIQG